MKLLRYGPPGAERPGLLDETGTLRDLSARIPDLAGPALDPAALDRLRALDPATLPVVPGTPRLGPCIATPHNIHCIGLNYRKHAADVGLPIPPEPILFSKATSALAGPTDPIQRPQGATKLDYEVEVALVIGRRTEQVSERKAPDCIAGFCAFNDVSERAWQFERQGQWLKGKSAPGFAPTGPWLVTPDEIADPQALTLFLDVNGETRQLSSTADMIFSMAEIVAYLSRFLVLLPGDIIATGTPEGVAMGMDPPEWLVPGDEVHLGVTGLGEQTQRVIDGAASQEQPG
ncbi:MAG: fumarylacetoacetate hydrolase family protein [Pikeienuella sp.]